MNNNPLSFRRQYESLIIKLSKNADTFSEMFIRTGEDSAYRAYKSYVKMICDLKDMIVAEEDRQEKDSE
jgi:hypothetical protein